LSSIGGHLKVVSAGAPAPVDPAREADRAALRRHGVGGTDHACYPPVERFAEYFDGHALEQAWADRSPLAALQPLSVQVAIPFCETQCLHCSRDTVIGPDDAAVDAYLDALGRELDLLVARLGPSRPFNQLQLTGGTPNYLRPAQLEQLVRRVLDRFQPAAQRDCFVEADPRRFGDDEIGMLADLGFNRLNLGLQEFHPQLQVAINRIQFEERTRAVMATARSAGFRSIAMQLSLGLPNQTRAIMASSLERLIALAPERIALTRYLHHPLRRPAQRAFLRDELPGDEACVDMMLDAAERLADAGYVRIGLDLFVRSDDDLALAARRGLLQRNAWGYSRLPEHDRVGLGLGAVSRVGQAYAQNHRRLEAYLDCLGQEQLPVMRGIELDRDDLARRAVISALLGRGEVSIESIEIAYLMSFAAHFADELEALAPMVDEGLVEISADWLSLTPRGRLVERAVCAVFDRYRVRGSEAGRRPRLA
jgi:oxygen-independent coproporphyrinogen-3 oxidase